MMSDADELDRLEWNEQRLSRDSARGKEIPRAPVAADVVRTLRSAREHARPRIKPTLAQGVQHGADQANPSRSASLRGPQLEEASYPQEASEDDEEKSE